MTEKESPEVAVLLMAKDIAGIKIDVGEIKNTLKADYVSRAEFEPVRKIVYGLTGLFLLGIGAGLLKLVLGV